MAQGPRSKKKRTNGSHNVLGVQNEAASPDPNIAKIRARLRLLDLRLESLQSDLARLAVSRQQTTIARSQYRTRSNLKSLEKSTK